MQITSSDRVLFPADGITKGEVVGYYRSVAGRMFPFIANRALTVERFPSGIAGAGFMQKNAPGHAPVEFVSRYEVPKVDGGATVYPVIDSPDGLTFFANLGAITFHVPTVTTDRGEQPDWVVWDLDPPPGRTGLVRQAAEKMRALLDVLAVPTLLMASGSNGYHLRCRLDGSAGADAVARLARGTAELAASMHSELMTVEFRKTRRAGRVFVDWLRNTPHATTVAPWSLRPRRGAPVACPIPWEDLWSVAPDGIYLGDVARLSDPWRDYTPVDATAVAPRVDRMLGEAGIVLEPFDRFRS